MKGEKCMSVINKKPFIKKILEETSDADLAVLNGLLNGVSTSQRTNGTYLSHIGNGVNTFSWDIR